MLVAKASSSLLSELPAEEVLSTLQITAMLHCCDHRDLQRKSLTLFFPNLYAGSKQMNPM